MTITLTREEAQQVLDALRGDSIHAAKQAIETLRARLSAPEPEPVAYMDSKGFLYNSTTHPENYAALYPAPPQREWQGLTDAEMMDLELSAHDLNSVSIIALRRFGRAVESKLKEKNS